MIASACKSSKVKCNVIKLPGSQKNAGMTAFVYICGFRKFPDRQILVACFPVAFLNGKFPLYLCTLT
jgi:hypothetical protein